MPKTKRRNPDYGHKHQYPGLDNKVIAADLEALLTPALYAQQAYVRQLGLRNRILNLSLMLAEVLMMLWRSVPSVQELTRMLAREDLLWCKAVEVSQQAVSKGFSALDRRSNATAFGNDVLSTNGFKSIVQQTVSLERCFI